MITSTIAARRCNGFTLIELVVAIIVGAIVVGMAVALMSAPIDSYMAQSRRSELVVDADRASRMLRMDTEEDVLPNSVRIRTSGNVRVVQMIKTVPNGVAFYQPYAPASPASTQLRVSPANDNDFYAYGRLPSAALLSVNNPGAGVNDAYRGFGSGALSAAGVANTDNVTLLPPYKFPSEPALATHRVFTVSQPVTYVCNLTTQTLRRYSNHAFAATAPASEADAQLNSAGTIVSTVANGITGCNVTCANGPAAPCLKSVALDITISRGTAPNVESIKVFQQLWVPNNP